MSTVYMYFYILIMNKKSEHVAEKNIIHSELFTHFLMAANICKILVTTTSTHTHTCTP